MKPEPLVVLSDNSIQVNTGLGKPLKKMNVEESGKTTEMTLREKGFTPGELYHLLSRAGFSIIHVWGGTAGAWQKKPLDLDEYEIMVLAEKSLS